MKKLYGHFLKLFRQIPSHNSDRNSTMRSRTEAVQYLQRRGFHAGQRDWAMGETIYIALGERQAKDNSIFYEGVLYIYPINGEWAIDIGSPFQEEDRYSSLFEAVQVAEEIALHYDEYKAQIKAKWRASHQEQQAVATKNESVESIMAQIEAGAEVLHSEALLDWFPNKPQAGKYLFRSEEEMRQVWKEHGGQEGGMPQIDFSTHMVAAIFLDAGEYNSAPCIIGARKIGDSIKVFYGTMKRPWKMLNPVSVIKLPYADGSFEFIQTAEEDDLS